MPESASIELQCCLRAMFGPLISSLRLRSYLTILGILTARITAQSLSSLPPCGVSSSPLKWKVRTLLTTFQQTCINNMLGQALSLGCPISTDVVCLCSNEDFISGIRDCAMEACPNAADANEAVQFGVQYCASGECYVVRILLTIY